MKRIRSACLHQIVKFKNKEKFAAYLATLRRKGSPYVIDQEWTQEDGSVMIEIRRKDKSYSMDEYLK